MCTGSRPTSPTETSPRPEYLAAALLRRNLWIYGIGGLVLPFAGIKVIDMVLVALGMT